jgi:hypothetical protein
MKLMHSLKNVLSTTAFAAIVGAGLLIAAVPASAYTTCNREGDCWHTDDRITFPGVVMPKKREFAIWQCIGLLLVPMQEQEL